MKRVVHLEYGLVEGKPVHVSQVADQLPRQRPDAICPECHAPVIWKCGTKKQHHVAHKSETSQCAASYGEGALHLNAKLYLSEILNQAKEVQYSRRCALCIGGDEIPLSYEHASVEHIYGGRLRADIALLTVRTKTGRMW